MLKKLILLKGYVNNIFLNLYLKDHGAITNLCKTKNYDKKLSKKYRSKIIQ